MFFTVVMSGGECGNIINVHVWHCFLFLCWKRMATLSDGGRVANNAQTLRAELCQNRAALMIAVLAVASRVGAIVNYNWATQLLIHKFHAQNDPHRTFIFAKIVFRCYPSCGGNWNFSFVFISWKRKVRVKIPRLLHLARSPSATMRHPKLLLLLREILRWTSQFFFRIS